MWIIAISEGHGDAALALLKAGAETDKQNTDGMLAIDMAPDAKAGDYPRSEVATILTNSKVRSFILQNAELEGIDVAQAE